MRVRSGYLVFRVHDDLSREVVAVLVTSTKVLKVKMSKNLFRKGDQGEKQTDRFQLRTCDPNGGEVGGRGRGKLFTGAPTPARTSVRLTPKR